MKGVKGATTLQGGCLDELRQAYQEKLVCLHVLTELRHALKAVNVSPERYFRIMDSALDVVDSEPARFWMHPTRSMIDWIELFDRREPVGIRFAGGSLMGGSMARDRWIETGA